MDFKYIILFSLMTERRKVGVTKGARQIPKERRNLRDSRKGMGLIIKNLGTNLMVKIRTQVASYTMVLIILRIVQGGKSLVR